MGSLRTFVCGLCLTLLAPALPVCAETDPLPLFATCTGRLSALVEHQWLMQDPASDATERLRDQMADLLASVTAPVAAAHAMDLRLQAKAAEAALLSLATFSTEPAFAGQARQRAIALTDACTALLLSQART